MSYAFRKDLQGYRACNGPDDVGPDETYSELEPVIVPDVNVQKRVILDAASTSRDALIGRLDWLKGECNELLQAAKEASNDPQNDPVVLLQKANIAAINTAINSLVSAFDDPRVASSVNGAAKQAVVAVYHDIVQAFKVAAPGPHTRFKKLDAR